MCDECEQPTDEHGYCPSCGIYSDLAGDFMFSGKWNTIPPKDINKKYTTETLEDSIEVLTPGIGIKIKNS